MNASLSLSQMWLIVAARWRSGLLVALGVVLVVGVVSVVLPRKYTATSAVVLDVKSPDPIAGVVLPGMTVSSYMGTQVEVLQSERVLLRAIHAQGLDQDEALKADWQSDAQGKGRFESWIADQLARKVTVQPGKDANVVQISYMDIDPEKAARMANAIVDGYIQTTLELRTEPARQFSQLFDESTRKLRDELEAAQGRLSEFQRTNGIVATDEKLDIENERLSALSAQMVTLQGGLDEARSRRVQAGSANGDQMQEVLGSPGVVALTANLAAQEARLHELGERYGDRHPQVMELQANIAELRRQLSTERSRVAGSLGVNQTVSQSRLDDVRRALDEQRVKVLRLKSLRDDAMVLQRDVENAQHAYDAGFARKSQSTLESQATQTNVSVIRRATPPAKASWPRLPLNLAVGLLIGLALGLLTVLMREKADLRIRRDEDITEGLRLPLLGVVPGAPVPRRFGRALELT